MRKPEPRSRRSREAARLAHRPLSFREIITSAKLEYCRQSYLAGDLLPSSELVQELYRPSVLGGLIYTQRTPAGFLNRISEAWPDVPWESMAELAMIARSEYLATAEPLPNEQAVADAIIRREPGLALALHELSDKPTVFVASTLRCPKWMAQVAMWAFNIPKHPKPRTTMPEHSYPGWEDWQEIERQARIVAVYELQTRYLDHTLVALHLGLACVTVRDFMIENGMAGMLSRMKPFARDAAVQLARNKASLHAEWLADLQENVAVVDYARAKNIPYSTALQRAQTVGYQPDRYRPEPILRRSNAAQVAATVTRLGEQECQSRTTKWWVSMAFKQDPAGTSQYDMRKVRTALEDSGWVLLPGTNRSRKWGRPSDLAAAMR
jgi:hypothetical protein